MSRRRGRRDPVTEVTIKRASGRKTTKTITTSRDCFPGDAAVSTCCGLRPIAELQPHDVVLSFDRQSNLVVPQRVVKVYEYSRGDLLQFRCVDGTRFRATRSHSLLTRDGWRRARSLFPGNFVLILRGEEKVWCEIEAITEDQQQVAVYNLITTGQHNFIVDGIVAHNFSVIPRVRAFLHRLFFDRYYFWVYFQRNGGSRVLGAVEQVVN